MPEVGGPVTPVIRGDPTKQNFAFAASLPGDRQLIFSALTVDQGKKTRDVRVVTVASGEQRVLVQNASMARYLPTGHLLYMEGDPGVPMVAAFDPVRLAIGTPVPLWETVRSLGKVPALALSRTGTLLYLPAAPDRILAWVDRQQGAVEALPLRGLWRAVRLSPDGKRAAVGVERERIAVIDLERRVATEIAAGAVNPLWTPDGRRVAFGSDDGLQWLASDGSGTPATLYRPDTGDDAGNDGSWSPDGRALAFTMFSKDGPEIRILSKHGAEWKGQPFPGHGYAPRFSPDGRWLAYESMWESPDIGSALWVRAYPGGDARTKVSVAAGHDAIWSADGRELFYRDGDRFYAVPVRLSPTFSIGSARLIFSGPYLDTGILDGHTYDVSADGRRFLVVQISEEERAPRRFRLVQNWSEELKAKVPATR
jgi:dipeptidyl aminopeptidase/acylaminoacyl peptidase